MLVGDLQLWHRAKDLRGRRFAYLTIIGLAPQKTLGKTQWYAKCGAGQRYDTISGAEPEVLRLQDEGDCVRATSNAWNDEPSCISRLGEHEGSVSAADAQGVEELRGPGDQGLQTMAEVRKLLGGHGADLPRGLDARSEEQRERLLEVELRLGDDEGAGEQHAPKRLAGHAERAHDNAAGRGGVWDSAGHSQVPTEAWMVSRRCVDTFDLVNCGPRHRFVVRGKNRELLIVHNCQNFAEGIARDLLVNGLQNLETAGYNPIGSVHDEGLFEPAKNHGSFEEAKKLFLAAPAWSAGLPLNAAGFRGPRYRK